MSLLLAALDLIGFCGFILAAVYAYRNHERIKFASNMWFYFATAAMMAGLWSFVVFAREVGAKIPLNTEPALFFALILLFTLFSIMSNRNVIKPFNE